MKLFFLFLLICGMFAQQQIDGIMASFNLQINGLDTCNILNIAMFDIPFNTCIPIHPDNQPNCSIYFECAIKSATFNEYQTCLDPGSGLAYVLPTFKDYTMYTVVGYQYSNCSGTQLFSQDIPFDCFADSLADINNTICNITQVARAHVVESAGVGLEVFWGDWLV